MDLPPQEASPKAKNNKLLEATTLIELYEKDLSHHGKEPATVESYSHDARSFLNYLLIHRLPYDQVVPETLMSFQEYLTHDRSEKHNSVRRSVIGIRQFYRFLVSKSMIKGTPFDEIAIPARDDILKKSLTLESVELLIEAACRLHPPLKAARDQAIVALLAFEGVKATELIALKWQHLMGPRHEVLSTNGEALPLKATHTLHIQGKRSRVIQLSPKTSELLLCYQHQYQMTSLAPQFQSQEKFMFCAFKGRDGALVLPKMTRHGLKFVMYELGTACGIPKLNSEQLRHHAMSFLLFLGKTSEEIMIHLGLRRPGNIAKHIKQENV